MLSVSCKGETISLFGKLFEDRSTKKIVTSLRILVKNGYKKNNFINFLFLFIFCVIFCTADSIIKFEVKLG